MKIEINNLERNVSDGGVVKVHWHAFETYEHLNNHQISVTGVDVFEPNSSSSNFKPYDELTEEDVISWLENKSDWLKNVQQNIDNQLKMLASPHTESGIPWLKNNFDSE